MNHQVNKIKFAHSKSQRMAILKNLAKDLIKYGHLKTTKTKAKAVVPFVEKMITYIKKNESPDSVIFSKISDKDLTDRLKTLSANELKKISSGYFSIYNLGNRKGDGAEMCIITMHGYEPRVKTVLKKVKKTSAPKTKKDEDNKGEKVEVKVQNKKTKEANK